MCVTSKTEINQSADDNYAKESMEVMIPQQNTQHKRIFTSQLKISPKVLCEQKKSYECTHTCF